MEWIKKNWLYVALGLVALLLLTRGGGGSSGASDFAMMQAAQSQAAQQNAQMGLVAEQQRQEYQLQRDAVNADIALRRDTLNADVALQKEAFQLERAGLDAQIEMQGANLKAQMQAIEAATQSQYIAAQGELVQGFGVGASQMVNALYQPAIAAMQSAAYENAASLQAGAAIAIGGFDTQKGMLDTAAKLTEQEMAGVSSFANFNQGVASILQTRHGSGGGGLLGGMTNLLGTFMGGGGMAGLSGGAPQQPPRYLDVYRPMGGNAATGGTYESQVRMDESRNRKNMSMMLTGNPYML